MLATLISADQWMLLINNVNNFYCVYTRGGEQIKANFARSCPIFFEEFVQVHQLRINLYLLTVLERTLRRQENLA